MPDDRLYFRQLLAGRDFAATDPIAQQMRNFAYLIGDRDTGDCVMVDPAYAAGLHRAAAEGVEVLCYDCNISPSAIRLARRLPWRGDGRHAE